MKHQYPIFRSILWIICIYHVAIAVILNLPADQLKHLLEIVFGTSKPLSTQALFIVRILGIYMLIFGIGMGLAAWNPIKNRALLSCGAILIGIRALQRLLQADYLEEAFGVASERNWIMALILAGFAVVILAFRIKLFAKMKKVSPNDT
jgi:hypothetical protein